MSKEASDLLAGQPEQLANIFALRYTSLRASSTANSQSNHELLATPSSPSTLATDGADERRHPGVPAAAPGSALTTMDTAQAYQSAFELADYEDESASDDLSMEVERAGPT